MRENRTPGSTSRGWKRTYGRRTMHRRESVRRMPRTLRAPRQPLTLPGFWLPPVRWSDVDLGQVLSYVRPLGAALVGRGPVWCSCDRIQIAQAGSMALGWSLVFPTPSSRPFALTPFLASCCPHLPAASLLPFASLPSAAALRWDSGAVVSMAIENVALLAIENVALRGLTCGGSGATGAGEPAKSLVTLMRPALGKQDVQYVFGLRSDGSPLRARRGGASGSCCPGC